MARGSLPVVALHSAASDPLLRRVRGGSFGPPMLRSRFQPRNGRSTRENPDLLPATASTPAAAFRCHRATDRSTDEFRTAPPAAAAPPGAPLDKAPG